MACKGNLRQVFIRIYRLEIQSVMLVFSTQLFVNCCPSPLLSGSTLPPPLPLFYVHKYNVFTYIVCKGGGGYGVLGLRQINTCLKVPLPVNFR